MHIGTALPNPMLLPSHISAPYLTTGALGPDLGPRTRDVLSPVGSSLTL